MYGTFRTSTAATAQSTYAAAAVSRIANGVGRCGLNAANTGVRMNMCMRYIP